MSWFSFRPFSLTNIYHCTVHKAGSRWLRNVLADKIVYAKTGMKFFSYQDLLPGKHDPRKVTDRFFYLPFPEKRIVTPLYISYDCYTHILKPSAYKSIYIYRDPRDVLVSYYYSVKQSHVPMGNIDTHRNALTDMEKEKGLIYAIDTLAAQGVWDSMRSWRDTHDANLLCIRYEDLISEQYEERFTELLTHLHIHLSTSKFGELLQKYQFKSMSGGRKSGSENTSSHLRKGVAGDWQNHFTDDVLKHFRSKTNDLHLYLGYGASENVRETIV